MRNESTGSRGFTAQRNAASFDSALQATAGRRRAAPLLSAVLGCLALAGTPALHAQETGKAVRPGVTALANLQDAFAEVADSVEPAVVTVFSTKTLRGAEELPQGLNSPERGLRRSTGTGSGVIIRKEGWILTNDHVVGGADKVSVKLHDGREFTGTVLRDFRSDLALIKISAPADLPFAPLGNSDKVKIGHWAIAIGSPYRFEGSFSVGVISSLNRLQRIADGSGSRERLYPNMMQTDAAINPGNSGGPLCNLNGEVIAINTAIESDHTGMGGGSIGIGFAIPINSAKFVIDQLLSKGRVSYGYLGVAPKTVSPRLASTLNVSYGALIDTDPTTNSPADKAGLKAGDVVTAIDNKAVHNEAELRTIIAQTAPETKIQLTVVRDGKTVPIFAVVTEAEGRVTDADRPRPGVKAKLGIEVQPLTKSLAAQTGFPADKGVLIKTIDASSAASDNEEISEGCLVLKVNNVDTPTVAAFQTAIKSLKSGDMVKIVYLKPNLERDPGKHFTIVEVD
jgi:serine protease Do